MSANPAPPGYFPNAAVTVRTMRAEDVPAIVAVETRAYEFPWTEANFIDSLNAGYIGLIAEEPGAGPGPGQNSNSNSNQARALYGYAILMPAVDDLHILNLCVAPAVQGRGVGQRLLAEVRRVTLERMMHSILLEVRPSNTHAVRLYEKFGFSEIGRRRNYYPARNRGREDAIVMRAKVKWSDSDAPR